MNNLFYQELLHDHYRNPRHKGVLPNATIAAQLHNPSCGDSIAITADSNGDLLQQVMFIGQGCVISQAAASLLMESLAGKSFRTILEYDKDYMITLLGISIGPVRLKCALLALDAVQQAIKDHMALREHSHDRSHAVNARISKES